MKRTTRTPRRMFGVVAASVLVLGLAPGLSASANNGKGRGPQSETTVDAGALESDGSTKSPKTSKQNGRGQDTTTTTTTTTTEPSNGEADPTTDWSLSDPTGWYTDAESLERIAGSAKQPTSMAQVVDQIGADEMWAAGYTGAGVDVAVIDTGVVPVAELSTSNVFVGPDLSLEGGVDAVAGLDTFGHGTHMARHHRRPHAGRRSARPEGG